MKRSQRQTFLNRMNLRLFPLKSSKRQLSPERGHPEVKRQRLDDGATGGRMKQEEEEEEEEERMAEEKLKQLQKLAEESLTERSNGPRPSSFSSSSSSNACLRGSWQQVGGLMLYTAAGVRASEKVGAASFAPLWRFQLSAAVGELQLLTCTIISFPARKVLHLLVVVFHINTFKALRSLTRESRNTCSFLLSSRSLASTLTAASSPPSLGKSSPPRPMTGSTSAPSLSESFVPLRSFVVLIGLCAPLTGFCTTRFSPDWPACSREDTR